MATKCFLRRNAETTPISPTPDSAWEDISSVIRAILRTVTSGDSHADVTIIELTATDKDCLARQYIARLAAGQTITGAQAVQFVARFQETVAGNNMHSVFGIRVIAANGTTVQKTILAVTREANEMVVLPTALTARNNTATSAATDYTTVAGDYLVIEIGAGGDPSGSNVHTYAISLGDNTGTFLTANDTETTDNDPWVQLADTLTLISYFITATQGTLTLTGQAATLTANRKLAAAQATFTLTGNAATLSHQYNALVAAQAVFTLTGNAAGLSASRLLTATQAAFTLTGSSAGLHASRVMAATQAAFTLTGNSVGLLASRTLTATHASFTLAGNATALQLTRTILASHGAFALSGISATLTFSGGSGAVLVAASGSFAVNGFAAMFAKIVPVLTYIQRNGVVIAAQHRDSVLMAAHQRQDAMFSIVNRPDVIVVQIKRPSTEVL